MPRVEPAEYPGQRLAFLKCSTDHNWTGWGYQVAQTPVQYAHPFNVDLVHNVRPTEVVVKASTEGMAFWRTTCSTIVSRHQDETSRSKSPPAADPWSLTD